MAPPGNHMIAHEKTGNRTSWGHPGTTIWYNVPSLEHYICMQCYMPATGIVRITYTLQYIPKAFSFPKTTTEDYLQQEIGDIIAIMKDTPKTLPLFSYGDARKNAINQISHILQRNTSHPRLQVLPSPPMLPQTQSENPHFQNIPSIPVPAPRVEPVLQPPMVQTHQSEPTPPPREKPSTSPILDPHSNPWIKNLQNILRHPRFPKPGKTSGTPASSTPLPLFPVQL